MEEFEDNLSKHFYRQSFESLNLNSYYTDWLLHWYRQSSPKQNTIGLFTTYFIYIMKSYKVYTDQKYYIDEYGCLCYDQDLSEQQSTVFEVTGMYLSKDMIYPSFEIYEI